jgi:iron complex transport system substrate-binding protein
MKFNTILKSILLLLFISLAEPVFAADQITITDMAKRKVKVPKQINSVLSRAPIGTILMYSINPKKIAGQSWTPTENEKMYLDQEFLNLPILSGWYGDGKIGNVEEIIKVSPDIILSAFYNKPSKGAIDQANRIQSQLNIPVVMFNIGMEFIPQTYQFIGSLINENERSKMLATYTDNLLQDVKYKAEQITPDMEKTIYYAEGPTGLQSDPVGSWHTRVIDFIHGKNVAQVKMKSGVGRATVSPEQLMQWNPDVIIACHDQGFANTKPTYKAILADARLNSLTAIKNNRVYEVPYKPFNFIDRPPSINRLLGLKWLGHLIYPDIFNYDLYKETKEFYHVFYNVEISKEQLDDLFKYSK